MKAEPVYLTTEELARRWKVSPSTIRNRRSKGEGPPYFKPFGPRGEARYKLEDVEAYEQSNTVGERAASRCLE